MHLKEKIMLSDREKAIIQLVAQAKGRKAIASELKLSIHTVDTHLRHIHLKTNTHTVSELLLWAINTERLLISPNYE
jgi:DNA-binding CsgD family transcriptional regulator